jgi:hypothetical protein
VHRGAQVQSQLDNEAIFPTRIGVPFPDNFRDICSNIFRRLFRVYGHIYHSHFESILNLGAEPHLNTYARAQPGGRTAERSRGGTAPRSRWLLVLGWARGLRAGRVAGWLAGWLCARRPRRRL